nr:integrase family protein [uncultured Devosia sp.]
MPSIDITATTIKKAKTDARAGSERYEITDARQRGLCIRVGAAGVRWQVRWKRLGKNSRLDIGDIDDWTIVEAREVASKAQAFLRTTAIPDEAWLHKRKIEYKKIERSAPEPRLSAPVRLLWDFETAKDEYLAEVKRTRRDATWTDYKNMLAAPELDPIRKRLVADIKRERLAEIVAGIFKSGRERHAEHLASVLRPMWTYLGGDAQIRRSGITPGIMTGLRAPTRTLDEGDDGQEDELYVPPLIELGRILSIARTEGVLDEQIGLAVQLTVYTAQRVLTIVSAKVSHFEEVEGGGLWAIPPARRKSGTSRRGKTHDHVIPLPPPAWRVVQRAMEVAADRGSPWLFPGYRPRKAGSEVTHMNKSVLTRALLLMPDVVASPHDIRRSFATLGESVLGLKRSDTKAILDHSEGEKSGDVTRQHYALHNGAHFKWPISDTWVTEVEAQVPDAVAEDPRLLDAVWLKAQVDLARYGDKTSP